MKFDSGFLAILSALFITAVVISAANAVDFNSGDFGIDVPSGSNFTQEAITNVSVADVAMNMVIFENVGNNSNDVSTLMYLKDSSSDKNMISDLFKDLKKDNEIVEENDNYTVFKTQNSKDLNAFHFDTNDLGSAFSFVNSFISNDKDINISSEGDSVSLSDEGLKVSDAGGDNVSISSKGIEVSSNASDDLNGTVSANVSIDGDINPKIKDDDYVIYVKNQKNDQVILIAGDNLDLIKKIAGSASFS